MVKSHRSAVIQNGILASLPGGSYRRLIPQLSPVTLSFGDVLFEAGGRIGHVYFPGDSLVSLITLVEGASLEVGMIGREGMVGSSLALGVAESPVRALVQGEGSALRMPAARFRSELGRNPALQAALQGYIHSLMMQIAQTAACNRFHGVEARLARWLLMMRDRLRTKEFRITQEFLSYMLGVRRVGVTEAASALQRRQLIEYTRGQISIVNGPGLESAACACYKTISGFSKKRI